MKNPAQAVDMDGRPMDAYDAEVWMGLNAYWEKKADPQALKNRAGAALGRGGDAAGAIIKKVTGIVLEAVKKPICDASDVAAEKALAPAVESIVHLLDMANAWVLELNDPKSVEALARKQGLRIGTFADLRDADLKTCDRLLDRNTLIWRTLGAVEGGAMGALAMVPVAGTITSISADVVVIQALSNAIVARVAYSYGFDAKDAKEREFIGRLVNRSFMSQVAKAEPMAQVGKAAGAIKGRVRWSDKLRNNHKLIADLERLMNQAGMNGGKVSVKSVGKAVPVVGVVLGAGTNSAVLGSVAADAKRYCQTRFLCERYGLPMPAVLAM